MTVMQVMLDIKMFCVAYNVIFRTKELGECDLLLTISFLTTESVMIVNIKINLYEMILKCTWCGLVLSCAG